MRRAALLPFSALLAACGGGAEPAAPVAATPAWREVATGYHGTCALDGAGTVLCAWPTQTGVWALRPLLTGERLSGLVMGENAACALTEAGALRCRNLWGGALLLDDDGLRFRQISGDPNRGCGLATDGRAYCWHLEEPTPETARAHPAPVAGAPALATVAAGGSFACGLGADGAAYCWTSPGAGVGFGEQGTLGQLGNGERTASATAVRVRTAARFVRLSAGVQHACALTAAGEAYCWGYNQGQQLGVAPRVDAECFGGGLGYPQYGCTVPQRVQTTLRFREIRAGSYHTCALAADGRAYCWGANTARTLGVLTVPGGETCRFGAYIPCTAAPVAVSGGLAFAALGATSGYRQCATTSAGRAYCWGAVRPDGLPVPSLALDDTGEPAPVPLPEPPAGG